MAIATSGAASPARRLRGGERPGKRGRRADTPEIEVDSKVSVTVNCAAGYEGRGISAASPLPVQLSIPARKKKSWSPALLCGVLWRGLTHVGTHRKVLRFLLKFPAFTEFVFSNPSFAIKYLAPFYLAKGFTVAERATCFLHHYKRLQEALPDSLLRRTLHEDVTIHEFPEGDRRFTLTMGLSRPFDEEGELSIHLQADGEIVFVLSFTIVPGWVVKSPAAEIVLISRIQGIKGAFSQISTATRTLHDVAPGALLLAALQGIAAAFGIGEIAAVCATRQIAYKEVSAASFREAYDEFFAQLGIGKNAAGFFCSALPLEEKPLALIKHGHKIRTREKRAFKLEIQLACAGFVEKFPPAASGQLPIDTLIAPSPRG
ncbi:MAG: DUF535 family protein [Terracidiphilus sp.]